MKTWKEFTETLPDEELSKQGARCMDCGIPFCHSTGCPVYNLIPEWNDLVYRGDWREALVRLEMTNNLPEITGRVCPAPCEASCTLAINTSPVSIKQLELAIIERGFSEGWVEPRPPRTLTGKRVAVVGSGPAGMAASQQLCRSGHEVTLFERSPKIGGLLRYGIPDFKLEKQILDRRIRQMEAEGVRFETGVTMGEDISSRYLRGNFDVVLLTLGAGASAGPRGARARAFRRSLRHGLPDPVQHVPGRGDRGGKAHIGKGQGHPGDRRRGHGKRLRRHLDPHAGQEGASV